jgi:hypothetical protein
VRSALFAAPAVNLIVIVVLLIVALGCGPVPKGVMMSVIIAVMRGSSRWLASRWLCPDAESGAVGWPGSRAQTGGVTT